jgi:peptidoglycan-associated lipoprotein
MSRRLVHVSMVCMMALVVLGSGCARKKAKAGVSGEMDVLGPVDGESAYTMPARFEDGVRVTDVTFQNVQFGYNQYQIEQLEISKIESVSQYLQQNVDVRLIAEGHCDERGSREYNVALGENRAQAVRAYLISLGVSGDRLQTRSYGEESPLDPGHSEAAWSTNRRVEFALYR